MPSLRDWELGRLSGLWCWTAAFQQEVCDGEDREVEDQAEVGREDLHPDRVGDFVAKPMSECGGAEFEVHLTLAARDALQLGPGKSVWVVVKTHSCHLMGM